MELDINPNKFDKYQCPCCWYYTFGQKLGNTYSICHVCYWEDDEGQLNDPTEESGANYVSLNEARKNFKEFGASERRFLRSISPPTKEELYD